MAIYLGTVRWDQGKTPTFKEPLDIGFEAIRIPTVLKHCITASGKVGGTGVRE